MKHVSVRVCLCALVVLLPLRCELRPDTNSLDPLRAHRSILNALTDRPYVKFNLPAAHSCGHVFYDLIPGWLVALVAASLLKRVDLARVKVLRAALHDLLDCQEGRLVYLQVCFRI